MTTTISPSLGHAPVLTQAGIGTTPGYDAIDFRRLGSPGLQEGVMGVASYEVTQRGAGANMSVDIAASTADALGSGVAALIQGDAVTAQGLYPVPPHSAVINETVSAAHATLPRVDAVILELQDTTHDASGGNLARTRVVAGTATAGATLDNARDGSHGGAAIPSSALHLADILVGAAATSITNAVIRDRRKWARGAFRQITRSAGNYTETTGVLVEIDTTNLKPRIECSGVPVRVMLSCVIGHSAAVVPAFDLFMDGATVNGPRLQTMSASGNVALTIGWVVVPSAGSHRFSPAFQRGASGTLTAFANTNQLLYFTVEEIVRQDAANNATTTG